MEFDALRRWPDFEAAELRAWDAADRLILDEAAPLLTGAPVTVIGDEFGALTLGALAAGATDVRVHQDSIVGERATRANAERVGVASGFDHLPLDPALVADARLVLLRLPRSLDALDEIAALIAAHADPSVTVIAGGRIKHMSLGMNEVLQRHFGRLDVSLARQKSRLLIAREPIPGPGPTPRREFHVDLDLTVVATGGVFAGTSVDIGTRAMLAAMAGLPRFESAIDLGCGTGILAAELKRRSPGAAVLATDRSAAAASSARLTAEANHLDLRVTQDDAATAEPDDSVDLVLLNPPFHIGAAVDPRIATHLFQAAARVLRPGGELWTVFNSHLGYRPQLERIVGPTKQISRKAKFTVTASATATQ